MPAVKCHLATAVRFFGPLLLCGCAGHGAIVRGPGGEPVKFSHPGLASSQAVFLKLYRATPEGLLVAGLYPQAKIDPDRNPGTVAKDFTFTADPSVHGSYFWKFAGGVTLLDGACKKTDVAGFVAAAAQPGAVSVQFLSFYYADKRPWAPPAVHVFNRTLGEATDCSAAVFEDPDFAPHPA